jgi:hypothetical protein
VLALPLMAELIEPAHEGRRASRAARLSALMVAEHLICVAEKGKREL